MGKVAGRKKRIIATTAAMLVLGGGAAFAYWSAAGTGDATSTAGTAANFTITSKVSDGDLTPNGAGRTITFTVTNPGTGVQQLSSVVASVAGEDGAEWAAKGCSAEDYAVGKPVFEHAEIAPGRSVTGTVTLQMVDRPGVNQDGCKEAKVPVHLEAG